VGVTDDNILSIKLLGSTEIVGVGVDEVTGLQVLNGHLDCESSVGLYVVQVLGEDEFAGGLVGLWRNVTHWDGVT
jgi:hypothetical protein